jgi:hypothetical protein
VFPDEEGGRKTRLGMGTFSGRRSGWRATPFLGLKRNYELRWTNRQRKYEDFLADGD